MMKNTESYFDELKSMFNSVAVTDRDNKTCLFSEAIDTFTRLIGDRTGAGGKLLFIGNGGSASIASHITVDLWKNAGIRALAFNDSSLLTCISNDYGYRHVFEKPIEMFAGREDILVAISSSGRSENILCAVSTARKKGMQVITFSGFDENNPLRNMGDMNFYVPSASYGHVEITHLSICHCVVDAIMAGKNG